MAEVKERADFGDFSEQIVSCPSCSWTGTLYAFIKLHKCAVASHAPATAGSAVINKLALALKGMLELEHLTHRVPGTLNAEWVASIVGDAKEALEELADSPAPSAPATGKEENRRPTCGECGETMQWEHDDSGSGWQCPACLSHKCAEQSATQSGASATQGAREWHEKSNYDVCNNPRIEIDDVYEFSDAYNLSLRSEVERLKVERDALAKTVKIFGSYGVHHIPHERIPTDDKNYLVHVDTCERCFVERTVSELRARMDVALKTDEVKPVIDWDRLKCYGCGEKATRIHKSFVVPICDRYPQCEAGEGKAGE